MKDNISMVIVDDHPVVRDGLAKLIQCDNRFTVTGTAQNCEEAIRVIGNTKPDLAIVDICLEDELSGLFLIRALRKRFPKTLILVLSMYEENTYAVRAYRSGAHGYITKKQASEKILEALIDVMSGDLYFSKDVMEEIKLLKKKDLQDNDIVNILTNRELEVFQLIGKGLSTIKIAAKLNLSKNTIDSHKRNIKLKLNLQNNNDLIKNAVQWLMSGNKGIKEIAKEN